MKSALSLCLMLVTSVALAGPPHTIHVGEAGTLNAQGMAIHVSGDSSLAVPIESLPVKGMTEDQFKQTVATMNAAALKNAHDKHTVAVANGEFPPIVAHVGNTKMKGSSTYRATDAFGTPAVGVSNAGYGSPFGGTGGGGFGGGGYGGGGYGGGGYGGGTGGNATSNTLNTSSFEYDKVFKNTNDGGGGPVTTINPYCYDYWQNHAK